MRRTLLCGVAMVALLLGASAAPAATITRTASFVGTANEGSASGTMSLELFNSNLGTLNSVLVVTELSATSDYEQKSAGDLVWTSGSSSSSTSVHPMARTKATLTGGPSQLAGAAAVFVTEDGGSLPNISGGTTYPFVASASDSPGVSTSISSPLSDWGAAGTHTDTLDVAFTTTSNLPGGFSLTWPSGGPDVTYTVTVEYNYTPTGGATQPTPEPASMAVLGGGLLALGAVRKRKKR